MLLLSCGDDGSTDPTPTAEDEPFFPADFEQTYVRVRECRFSTEHDLAYVEVYVDSGGAQAYLEGVYPLPVGTVCVKTLRDIDDCTGTVRETVAMKKGTPGTAPATNDWVWQTVRADSIVEESGQLAQCIACHAGCTLGRDFTCMDSIAAQSP